MQKQISWEAPEYHFQKKSGNWYIWFSVIALAILGYALYTGDYLMFVTLFLLFVFAYSIANRRPEIVRITVSGKGIQVGEKLYSYSDLKKFWFVYLPPQIRVLYIEPKKRLLPAMQIELGEQDPNDVRELLLNFLQEDLEAEESFADKLLRRLGL